LERPQGVAVKKKIEQKKEKSLRIDEVIHLLKISRRQVYYLVERGFLEPTGQPGRITSRSADQLEQTINVEQIAGFLEVSKSQIYEIVKDGKLKPFTLDGKILRPFRFTREAIFNNLCLATFLHPATPAHKAHNKAIKEGRAIPSKSPMRQFANENIAYLDIFLKANHQ
jgi:predicted DNA-binding transcriptional regulator AlpA